jgi:hypothetical protein
MAAAKSLAITLTGAASDALQLAADATAADLFNAVAAKLGASAGALKLLCKGGAARKRSSARRAS